MFGMHLEKNWEYRTKGTVYSKPLVADVTPNPSDEIIISDGEARILRCIDSLEDRCRCIPVNHPHLEKPPVKPGDELML